jgi:D-3-phosphoglycerate dehydrogenase
VTTRLLAAGDHFVLNSLLLDAVRHATDYPLHTTELTLPWPHVPFGPIAEVHEASGTEEELIEALRGVEICVTQMAPLTRTVLDACPDLRLFCVTRGGPVNANLDAATERGVAVCFAPGRNATATAEHTLGLILAATRRIPSTHAFLVAGVWRGDQYAYDQVGPELEDATVGLVGCGAIGRRVARALGGFGAHVLIHDPHVDPTDLADLGEPVDLNELLERSQIVSLHARATPQTKGMIGAEQIGTMPTGSVIVNCARGSLLDYDAVCDALDVGHLFAAAFDVYPEEPVPPDSRLLTTRGVVMTPHLAGASKQTAERAADIAAAEVARYVSGEPLVHCANPDVKYMG